MSANAQVDRSCFEPWWLVVESREEQPFARYVLAEHPGRREHIQRALREALIDHYVAPAQVAVRLEALGHAATAQWLSTEQMPQPVSTRHGDFGEILLTEHLVQRHGYTALVHRLRHRELRDMAVRGEDVLVFRLDHDSIVEVAVGEAKVRSEFKRADRRAAVVAGAKRLKDAWKPAPQTLSLIETILAEMDDPRWKLFIDLGARLATGATTRSNWLMVVTGNQPADIWADLGQEDALVSPLVGVHAKLADLPLLISDLFGLPLGEASEGAGDD